MKESSCGQTPLLIDPHCYSRSQSRTDKLTETTFTSRKQALCLSGQLTVSKSSTVKHFLTNKHCTYRFAFRLKFLQNKSEISWSDLVISHALTQAPVVILVQTAVKDYLKFTCYYKNMFLKLFFRSPASDKSII